MHNQLRETSHPTALQRLGSTLQHLKATTPLISRGGTVREITPVSFTVTGIEHDARLGNRVEVRHEAGSAFGEIIRITPSTVTVKAFDSAPPLEIGAAAWHRGPLLLYPDASWRGRVIDANGDPLDQRGPLKHGPTPLTPDQNPPHALQRSRIAKPLQTGVRVIDIFTPLAAGQRIGIFAGSGVGKSTLLAMLARALAFDTVVVALVGERGREVREFLEGLHPDSRARTIAVVSTGDQSPILRRLAPKTAMTIAEYFRDLGDNVLLIVDSVTRYAHAAREVALAAGEPPVARGYTPSVFSDLPRLLERAGAGHDHQGTITGLFSVLVDGDDHNDPVADSIRGTLDGHIVLDRTIAEQARYPAMDPLASVSRLAHLAWTPEQQELVLKLRSMISSYEDTRDLRLMGGYREGADPHLDRAVALVPRLYDVLKQRPESAPSRDAFADMARALQS